ncbi:MAG: formylglycine-generating enzyme family protein [Burkholderiaceae bacterium]|nr:formylglycine-generating enzyme family protein [Burkholderiaceae bacterium]
MRFAILLIALASGPWAAAARPAGGVAVNPAATPVATSAANPAGIDWQPVGGFAMARTETTVGQFRRYVQATGRLTRAERQGGGEVYEAGWVRQPGWTWQTPFGAPAADDEPAVHLGFDEAQAFCRWAGGRLPRDEEWVQAAYLEQRADPPAGFERGRRYAFPSGASPAGAQCLDDCGSAARTRALRHGATLWRGHGHARVGQTPAGVNGLHDMGGNVWEWVDEPPSAPAEAEHRTRGGSWWYGQAQMREGHLQGKPGHTAVVYIGFRCLRESSAGPAAPQAATGSPGPTGA